MQVFDSFSTKYKILLATASPRRQALMRELNLPFTIVKPPATEEKIPKNLYREQIAMHLAKEKADCFNELNADEILITADTIVWINDKVLGKPENFGEAYQMLRLLSGKVHEVITGVCLKTSTKHKLFFAETKVSFANLSDDEIRYYIDNFKPYDKAGAYGIQEWIGKIAVEYIEGSYYNVVGLPMQKLYRELIGMCGELGS